MLKTLAEKVEPRHAALLIVDLQNDFCAEGGAMHREGRDVSWRRPWSPGSPGSWTPLGRQGPRWSGSAT
ncbi:MAG: hypothetical protein U1B78_01120, partial [Dehalococcoidia bacterium]|nr:hypothetical protein [Dehalococcoidia bacterium]